MSTRHAIAVVGAGAVGALTALLAARAGHDTLLLDAADAPQQALPGGDYDLRVIALAPGSRARLVAAGAWAQELAPRLQAYTGMQVWDGSGPGRIGFSASELGLPELGHIIEVPALQWALDQAIAAEPRIQRVQGAVYAAHELSPGGVSLRCRDGRSWEAALLVGADGRESRVRKRAGIELELRDYHQRGVVAVLQPGQPHGGVARQVFAPEGPLGLLPLANGQISIVWSVADAEAAMLLEEEPQAFASRVARASGLAGLSLVSRRAAFGLRLQHAARYADDVIALAGDAAHAVHPLAGLGMNLGIEDAAALIAALRGWRQDLSPEPALARYARERRRAVLPAIAMMDGLNALFGSRTGELVQLRDWGLNRVDAAGRLKQALMSYALGPGVLAHGQRSAKPV